MPSKVIQQLLNILQKANIEAVKIEQGDSDCKLLVTSLLFANGATGNGGPIEDPPAFYVGDHLVSYKTPGGEKALLTRAQVQVIMEFWDLPKGDGALKGPEPLGCCTDKNGIGRNNIAKSDCGCPPYKSWSVGPCGGYGDGGPKRGAPVPQPASGQGHNGGGS